MNDLYIIEKYDETTKSCEYLEISSLAKNTKAAMFRWTNKLSEAKIFRTHKEANKYESICRNKYCDKLIIKKRRLIVLREKMTKVSKFETIEIF